MVVAYGITDWLPRAVATYYLQPTWAGATLFVTAAFSMGGIYYMAFALFYRVLSGAGGFGVPLLAATAWVAAEIGPERVETVYARVGDLFAWACVCLVLLVSLRLRLRIDSRST